VQRVFSHSSLSSYETCPKKYELRYVLRVPVETEGIESFVGKRVHEVLERLYQFSGRGLVPSLERVLQRFRANFEAGYDPTRVRIAREGEEAADHLRVGERCLENAYRRLYPFDDETLGLEHPIEFDVGPDGHYAMRGVIDRVVRARDGALEIHDYKTGRWLPKQAELDRDRQLALYEIGARRAFGETGEVRLVWHFLRQNQVRQSSRTPDQLDAAGEAARATIDRIRAERAWEPRPSALCAWCEYRPLCPAFGGTAEAAPEAPPEDLDPPEDEMGQLSLW
jgi:putative RecB family exonuclease